MLAITISWLTMFFVLFSLGDIFVNIYNKLCKENEQYNILDTVLLGLCFLSLILSASSLWLPSDHFILLYYIVICLVYWIIIRRRRNLIIKRFRIVFKSLSWIEKGILCSFVVAIVCYLLFFSNFYDAEYYHYQNIRWNEMYKAIPGLGNLEDRFGFNSNYFLLSAVFSFSFLFTDSVYLLQSLLFIILLIWTLKELFKSKYNILYLTLFFFLFFIFCFCGWMLADSCTDILPLLCAFYYITKTALKPDWYKHQILLAYILPVSMIVFKLSMVTFSLASLFLLIYLIKHKKSRIVAFLLTTSLLIIVFWCIRNVIITGYLVYPLYQIDLFSFDWKMPATTLELQKVHIYNWAKYTFDVDYIYTIFKVGLQGDKKILLIRSLNFLFFIFSIISILPIVYYAIKRKQIQVSLYIIYFISILCMVVALVAAPDFRFMNGYILGISFLTIVVLFAISGKERVSFPKTIGKSAIFIILICCGTITIKNNQKTIMLYGFDYKEHLTSLLIKPWKPKPAEEIYTEYYLKNIIIYITHDQHYKTFDKIPCTSLTGLPFNPFDGNKIQSIETIEPRGNDIENGFRTKKEYIDILNRNIDIYKEESDRFHKKKYPNDYF